MVLNKEKTNAPRKINNGFHWPKIKTANAKKPKPFAPLANSHSAFRVIKSNPPKPDKIPEIITPT